jgi:hypothetical protein
MGIRIDDEDGSTTTSFSFSFDGLKVHARPGDTIATALLAEGFGAFRRDTHDAPRGPYCLAGSCYECLVEISAHVPGQDRRWQRIRACLTPAVSGIDIRQAASARSVD